MNSPVSKPIFKGYQGKNLMEKDKQPKQLNFNTVLNVIVIAVITWVGTSIRDGAEKLNNIDKRMAIMETVNSDKIMRLDRIETELSRQRDSLRDLQMDITRIKNDPKIPK